MRLRPPMAAAALAATGGLLLAAAGCAERDGAAARAAGGDRVAVVATTGVVADFARVVGGDRVHVTQILAPNVDAHDYEPSPADLTAISTADVVVRNGVGLESWFDDTISSAGFSGTAVDASVGVPIRTGPAAAGDGAAASGGESEAGGESEQHAPEGESAEGGADRDPHIWHDPRNAKVMVANVRDGLAAADPDGAATFRANAAAYAGKLDDLDATLRTMIGTVPRADRKLVTNHDAFGYFVARYGLTFVGAVIPSFDSAAELSGKDLSSLVDRIRQAGAKAVFTESTLPAKTAETVAREAGVRVVDGADALYGDSLGPPGSDAATYLQMMEHNAATIVEALGGRA